MTDTPYNIPRQKSTGGNLPFDGAILLFFALIMSVLIQVGADTGAFNVERIFRAAVIGVGSFGFAIVIVHLLLSNHLTRWLWIIGLGSLSRTVMTKALSLPEFYAHLMSLEITSGELLSRLADRYLYSTIATWVFWMACGIAFFLIVRFLLTSLSRNFHR